MRINFDQYLEQIEEIFAKEQRSITFIRGGKRFLAEIFEEKKELNIVAVIREINSNMLALINNKRKFGKIFIICLMVISWSIV
jgi:hypothetical protein